MTVLERVHMSSLGGATGWLDSEPLGPAELWGRTVFDHEAGLLALRMRYDSLGRREREVMTRAVAGHLNKQVGTALGISEITVKAPRGRVMRKMEVESLADLVTMALTLDLTPARGRPSAISAPAA